MSDSNASQPQVQDGSHEDDLKVIVLNYGKWKERKELEQLLAANQIAFKRVQKARQLSFGFVVFGTLEERDQALTRLPELQWPGKSGEHLEVKAALPKKSLKPLRELQDDRGSNKRHKRPRNAQAKDENENGEDRQQQAGDAVTEEQGQQQVNEVRDATQVVTPWAHLSYDEQLARKEAEMQRVLVKIVRQTRKEYAKKEKRIAQEQRNIARKKKQKLDENQQTTCDEHADNNVDANTNDNANANANANANDNANDNDNDNENANTNTRRGAGLMTIPEWLNSNGSLYVIADEVLYTRHHEAQEEDPWKRLVDASGMQAIVSYGSQLVAANSDGRLYSLVLQEGQDPTWNCIGKTPEDSQITSLGSLRGVLLCCTSDGRILKLEHNGNLSVGQWKLVGQLESAAWITVHNGFLYACCSSTSSACKWYQAQLTSDVLDQIEFEPCAVQLADVLGMTSHDGQLILLKRNELCFARQNGTVVKTVPLNLESAATEQTIQQWSGLTSHKGLCCWMDAIHASPQTDSYRNKCEFSIGFDADNKPCVGFRLGLFRDGSIVVSRPTDCINVPEVMKQVCVAMESLIARTEASVYDLKTHEGVWRMIMVRYSQRTNQLMIMIQVNPQEHLDKPEKYQILKQQIVSHFTSASLPFQVTSLYLHEYGGVSAPSEQDPVHKLHGEDYIQEELLGFKFNISPLAFFQVNTTGAETLYSLVHEHAQANAKTLLYDVCCGTGTIGICASRNVGKVVGIEICKSATEDAARNAKLNHVENVHFVNAKAEDVMRDLLQARKQDDEVALDRVVAIVDPPRGGLHHQVLRALRGCLPLQRVVYVSCNPTGSLIQDAITLCGPNTKSLVGKPFRPVHAVPVDMFPHTPHCEMVVVFDRQD